MTKLATIAVLTSLSLTSALAHESKRALRLNREIMAFLSFRQGADDPVAPGGQAIPYKLANMYQGQDFFESWNFWTTHPQGSTEYLTMEDAAAQGLATVDGEVLTLAADDQTVVAEGGKRKSVRILSRYSWLSGLFIADFESMPYGCGVTPTFQTISHWTDDSEWPRGGRVGIIDGANVKDSQINQYSVHAGDSTCSLDPSVSMTGTPSPDTLNCATSPGNDVGCVVADPSAQSFGQQFNGVGGGVFAHLRDSTGFKTWRFARDNIPEDITARNPDPSSWGPPVAFVSSSQCDLTFFKNHDLEIKIATCGDLDGETCPDTCPEALADPANFATAKWGINYVAVYQPQVA